MNHYLYTFLALELARDRSREAERRWLASSLANTVPSQTPWLRRVAARFLASVSRGSGLVARRLDACVADDLGRTLAPAE